MWLELLLHASTMFAFDKVKAVQKKLALRLSSLLLLVVAAGGKYKVKTN